MHGMDVECCVLVERVQIFKWIQVKNSIFGLKTANYGRNCCVFDGDNMHKLSISINACCFVFGKCPQRPEALCMEKRSLLKAFSKIKCPELQYGQKSCKMCPQYTNMCTWINIHVKWRCIGNKKAAICLWALRSNKADKRHVCFTEAKIPTNMGGS